ncbi:OLC1v1036229C1 [Oldenlandia corymbosa var. corymbosa]|uniref:OLC1v1036229C1 n=1 Tax=Oldenlandia corymbosa var. corymbosa TaxID=529605 RepID=A0AAV1CVC6_OLDCO|nr:OLC1v1036229C1 [Oldenlandia corymbosa var. corymbosa]
MTQTRSQKDLEEQRRSGEMSVGRLDVESRISDMESKFSDRSQQINEMQCSIAAIQGSMLQMNAQFKEFMVSFNGKEGIMGISATDKSKAPMTTPVVETLVDSPATVHTEDDDVLEKGTESLNVPEFTVDEGIDLNDLTIEEGSLHVQSGDNVKQTIVILGKIDRRVIKILIDSGSTYSFVDVALVHE